MSLRGSFNGQIRPASAKRAVNPRLLTQSQYKPNQNKDYENAKPRLSFYSRPATSGKSRPLGTNNHRRTSSTHTEEQPNKRHMRQLSQQTVNQNTIRVAHYSETGYQPQNPGKVNQDSYFECFSVRGSEFKFFGVCDGHGHYGERVSGYVKNRLPSILSQDNNLFSNNKQALSSSICKLSYDLMNSGIDANYSGTTLISVLFDDKKLWCANSGDSRALLGRQLSVKDSSRHWMSISLSRDHKPDEPDEQQRITRCGGRVESYKDQYGNSLGPARVWLRSADIPGLAMSRSIGDWVAESVGVIAEPEILEYAINPDDKFIVMGSDGIFDFLKNEEIVKLTVPYWSRGDATGACNALAKEARARWMANEDVIDDITCIVIFL